MSPASKRIKLAHECAHMAVADLDDLMSTPDGAKFNMGQAADALGNLRLASMALVELLKEIEFFKKQGRMSPEWLAETYRNAVKAS